MAEKIIQIVSTEAKRLVDLPIVDAQLIFIKDRQKIAMDLDSKRTFYNDIEILDTESERQSITPVNGRFYFVIGTAVLWFYQDKWIQLTTPPQEFLFIGTELPTLGSENTLYVNKEKQNISVWDDDLKSFIHVGEVTGSVTESEIDALFD